MKTANRTTILLVPALIAGALTAVTTTSAAVADVSSPVTVSADAANIITQSGRIIDFYTALGVDATEIPTVSNADAGVIEGIVDLVAGPAQTAPSLPSTRPTDCSNTGALVAYARQVAGMNKSRDANAKTLDEETVYMYMSHFFDLPSLCGNPTAYYPDWITNSDRTAYTNYLTAANGTQLATSVGQLVLSATSFTSNPVPAIQKVTSKAYVDNLEGATDIADKALAGDTIIDEMQNIVTMIDADKAPQEIVDQMSANLSPTWSSLDTLKTVVGTAAALMLPTYGAMLFSLGAVAMSVQLTGVNTLVQVAAYNALRYSTSSRASSRFMRSMGM